MRRRQSSSKLIHEALALVSNICVLRDLELQYLEHPTCDHSHTRELTDRANGDANQVMSAFEFVLTQKYQHHFKSMGPLQWRDFFDELAACYSAIQQDLDERGEVGQEAYIKTLAMSAFLFTASELCAPKLKPLVALYYKRNSTLQYDEGDSRELQRCCKNEEALFPYIVQHLLDAGGDAKAVHRHLINLSIDKASVAPSLNPSQQWLLDLVNQLYTDRFVRKGRTIDEARREALKGVKRLQKHIANYVSQQEQLLTAMQLAAEQLIKKSNDLRNRGGHGKVVIAINAHVCSMAHIASTLRIDRELARDDYQSALAAYQCADSGSGREAAKGAMHRAANAYHYAYVSYRQAMVNLHQPANDRSRLKNIDLLIHFGKTYRGKGKQIGQIAIDIIQTLSVVGVVLGVASLIVTKGKRYRLWKVDDGQTKTGHCVKRSLGAADKLNKDSYISDSVRKFGPLQHRLYDEHRRMRYFSEATASVSRATVPVPTPPGPLLLATTV